MIPATFSYTALNFGSSLHHEYQHNITHFLRRSKYSSLSYVVGKMTNHEKKFCIAWTKRMLLSVLYHTFAMQLQKEESITTRAVYIRNPGHNFFRSFAYFLLFSVIRKKDYQPNTWKWSDWFFIYVGMFRWRFFFSPKRSDRLWRPPSLRNGYRGLFIRG